MVYLVFAKERFSLALLFAFAAIGLLRADDVIFGGGNSQSDGFWISTPIARIRQTGPGVVWTLVQPPGGAKDYAYLLLVKGLDRKKISKHSGGCSNDGGTATSTFQMEVDGAELKIVYKIEIDKQTKKVESQGLTVNGKGIDLAKGRVLLVSASGKDFTWQQVAMPLPKTPTESRSRDEIEAAAKEHVIRLREGNETVREFLK
jgi:hypothetical protein